jgi:hypothetical protein
MSDVSEMRGNWHGNESRMIVSHYCIPNKFKVVVLINQYAMKKTVFMVKTAQMIHGRGADSIPPRKIFPKSGNQCIIYTTEPFE